ncbi:hypothetical protein Ade02nite_19190 [Paractinoplanes deccanensis]|uniref:Uncharacterized protein n=1 Tax=Paractinoplanes deccanensis TaxID=113561 RepID=A0ABQ3XZW3_9ACTN|nr:hypothetical protein [Actinoplanes deccanensis]GID73278.1 hypothetical protein Ade02nite_19190 [Actinoplanes deccanensis]
MSIETLPSPSDTSVGDDVDHYYCCDPNVAFCGLDLTDVLEGPGFHLICPLCALAEESGYRCPGCGRTEWL